MSAHNNTANNTGYGAEQGERGLGGQGMLSFFLVFAIWRYLEVKNSVLTSVWYARAGLTGGRGLGGQGGDLRGTTGEAPTHGSNLGTGASHGSHSAGSHLGGGASSGLGSNAGAGYDPATHQASEVGRHPGGAATHPTHPVAGAEAQDYSGSSSLPGSHSHSATGPHHSTHSSGITGQTSKDIAKHPGATASNPAHPGDAAASEDARKGGHLTDTGARRDPAAPTPAGASSTTGIGLSSSTHPSASTSHTGPHSSTTGTTGPYEGAHKPTIGDKVAGAVESLVGKVYKNPAKVEEGTIRKTEGKEAAQHARVTGAATHLN
ncbi:hypothetical protein JCM11641_000839 [Rhodosporidiobolus odoratus]